MIRLTENRAYKVQTTAGRTLYVLFKGAVPNTRRLSFINLDPPYESIPLRARSILSAEPIGAKR